MQWPEKPTVKVNQGYFDKWFWYERARADAAMDRLRITERALKALAIGLPRGPGEEDGFTYDEAADIAMQALNVIGVIPADGPDRGQE